MEQQDVTYYSRRAEIDKTANEIVEREIRANRDTMGLRAARLHGERLAADYQRREEYFR